MSTAPLDYRALEESYTIAPVPAGAGGGENDHLLTLNIGPHHPATHGVLRLLVTLDGEIVRDLRPLVGYLHTGIEKTCEDKTYWKGIPLVERMDYLAYYFNAMAYCQTVENLLDLEVPAKAQYLRVVHMELNRIMSHLFWFGTFALDIGAMSLLWYSLRERETVVDLFESSGGQRVHPRYFQIGGVADDVPSGWAGRARAFANEIPTRVQQFRDLLYKNEIAIQRLKGVGTVSAERLLELGVTGPLLRAAGVEWDLRKAQPYSSYEDFDFGVPLGAVGDNFDRMAVRLAEMDESAKIIIQALDGMPEGAHIADDRKVVLPPRHELATSMEALIHHFKLVTEGFRVPPGELYTAIEGPRGELGCFIRADGSAKPARVHIRDSSFVNLQATADMCRGGYVADLIATVACLDPILGGIDR